MRVRRCILVLSGYHSRVFAVVFCCDFLSYSKGRKYSWNITDREVGIFINVIGLIDIITLPVSTQ